METDSRLMHSSERVRIFLIPKQGKNICMAAAGNRAFDKNDHEEIGEGGKILWLVNNKGKVCTCSKRGRKVTQVGSISLTLILHEAFQKTFKTVKRLGNKRK